MYKDAKKINIGRHGIRGFIKHFGPIPVSINYFREAVLSIAVYWPFSDRFLHLDATGTICCVPCFLPNASVYTYILSIRVKQSTSHLPITELCSSQHNAGKIEYFVKYENDAMQKISAA